MICCQCPVERPYFFSMVGQYDAGPCFGRAGACWAMLVYFPCWLDGEAGRADWFRRCGDRPVPWVTRPGIVMTPGERARHVRLAAAGLAGDSWLRSARRVLPGPPAPLAYWVKGMSAAVVAAPGVARCVSGPGWRAVQERMGRKP